MRRWFPDLTTAEGLQSARKGAVFAAIAFGVLTLVTIAFIVFAGHMPGETARDTLAGQIGAIGGIAIETSIAFVTAYRFHRNKGLIIGSITLALFVFELTMKVINGQIRPGWILLHLAILSGLINGVRMAWAIRRAGPSIDTDLQQVFE